MKILLTLSYDGTEYCGWQRQINGVSIQEKLETALTEVYQVSSFQTTASSRTDAGVHSLCQKAAFSVEHNLIPLDKLPNVINRYMPKDIVVTRAESVPDSFNPRYMATRKTYEYKIYYAAYMNPLLRDYCFIPNAYNQQLDTDTIKTAAGHFIGTHDFASFCATGSSAKTTIRTVYDCSVKCISEYDDAIRIIIRITGGGFLYNMVRIIAGTLLYVGKHKINASDIPDIIAQRDRSKAGKTMPPQGLTLVDTQF